MKISIKNLVLVLSWVYSINRQRALGISYKCGEKNIGAVYLTVNQDFASDESTIGMVGNFKLFIFGTETLSCSGKIADIGTIETQQQILQKLQGIQVAADTTEELQTILTKDSKALANVITQFVSNCQVLDDLPKNWKLGTWQDTCEYSKQEKIYDRNGREIKVFGDFDWCWIWNEESAEVCFMKSVNKYGKPKLCVSIACDTDKNQGREQSSFVVNNFQDLLQKNPDDDLFLRLSLFYFINDEQILRQLPGKDSVTKIQVVDQDTHKCEEDTITLDNPKVQHELIILKATVDSKISYIGLQWTADGLAYKITESEEACNEKSHYISIKKQSKTILCLLTDIINALIPNWQMLKLEPQAYNAKILSMHMLKPAILFIFKTYIRIYACIKQT